MDTPNIMMSNDFIALARNPPTSRQPYRAEVTLQPHPPMIDWLSKGVSECVSEWVSKGVSECVSE